MNGYRGPNNRRIANQVTDNQFRFAGQTAVWRSYISASAGLDYAGYGDTPFYREQLITALFKATQGFTLTQPELQTPLGMTVDADYLVVTRQQLKQQDELVYRGSAWRIDSDSQPSRMDNTWINILKRGDT